MVKTGKKLLERKRHGNQGKSQIVVNMDRLFELIIEAFLLLVGTYLVSLSINMFLLPHKLTTGGVSGIGTILYYVMHIPVGITVLILNIPLFILSIRKLGFKFSLKTIVSTLLLSLFLEIGNYEGLITKSPPDLFTACIFGGLLSGIGLSLVFKTGASTGGSDLLAQIIYKTTPVQSLSEILMMIEMIIISGLIIVFQDINIGLYSLIALFISTKVIDVIFQGIYYTKVVNIITRKPEELIDGILNDLRRGATITKGIGAHSKDEVTTITCIVTRPQLGKLKTIVRQKDRNALMYITTSNEVLGEGFKEMG